MKRFKLLSALCFCTLLLAAQPKAKYVFYFIGDGMGVNQVNGTEAFLAAQHGRIGTQPLCFPSFPYIALVTTQSATNGVTDSAAAGTALASGHKTKNGAIGVKRDQKTPVKSIAEVAKASGTAVGIATSVGVNHATPASFYGHVANRNMYDEIGLQLASSGFDFFAGSDFLFSKSKDKAAKHPDLHRIAKDSGYTIVRGYPDFKKNGLTAEKVLLIQPQSDTKQWPSTIPYKIDQKPEHLSLGQITTAGIECLAPKGKGFFFMVEGGMIDMACHDNDAATYVHELVDFDSCVRIAYNFYLQHPDSTLIVVTADHETGGLVLGRGPYEQHLDRLAQQKSSLWVYTQHLTALRKEYGKQLSWDIVEKDLQDFFGFGSDITLSEKQEKRLKTAFQKWMDGIDEKKTNLYAEEDALSATAGEIISEQAGISWASGGHSNGYVGAYAVGVGAEQFHGRIDNTQIPLIIAHIAGWDLKGENLKALHR